eukprot:TRINITY_DN25547_c0_g1_i3.p1 TRINITY_DN25547_c0_g1~~TRINITY_DN25547_c0_g1_i3.p1  ORF type:complete len:915 (+),score=149.98 TRINITY_DN25547_c0_g1_i3:57-2747(+)
MDGDLEDAEIQAAIAASLGEAIDFEGHWECTACTFWNPAASTKCQVCDTSKTVDVAKIVEIDRSRCNKGHVLEHHLCTNKDIICDFCDKKVIDAAAAFRCQECNFDACWACHVDGQQCMDKLRERLDSEVVQDRQLGPCPIAPEGPLGESFIMFLQIGLSRREMKRKDGNDVCVQFACVHQHNTFSCGYYAFYNAKTAVEVIMSRAKDTALQALAGLRNADRALEFVKLLQLALKPLKPDVHKADMERWEAVELLSTHDALLQHKGHITLVLDPTRIEAGTGAPGNPSMQELDEKFSELRSGQRPFHAFIFGAGGHYLVLAVWSLPKSGDGEKEVGTERRFELVLLDSENRRNFSEAKQFGHVNEFVDMVSACTRDGLSITGLEFWKAANQFVDRTKDVVDDHPTALRDRLDDVKFVRDCLGLFEMLNSAQEERLKKVIQTLLHLVLTTVDPRALGRSMSSEKSRCLALQRTESGTLWAQRFNDRLRQLALDLVDLPSDLHWPPPISLPPRDMLKSIVDGSFSMIDMDEAKDLLMSIAHIGGGRTHVIEEDAETALRLLKQEQRHRQRCFNAHPLSKGKREKSQCSRCHKGNMTTSYLCKQPDCKYLCCDSCFVKERGSMAEACLRGLTSSQMFLVGEHVMVNNRVGRIVQTNGHAYKVLGHWHHQEQVQAAATAPDEIPTRTSHVINPPECSREYSSIFGNDAWGTGHGQSMLDSPQAWSAATSRAGEWMNMDLGFPVTVIGVVTEGRRGSDQCVTKFTAQYSIDGVTWENVPGEHRAGPQKVRVGFYDEYPARYVKLLVQDWNAHVSMRAAVLVKAEPTWSVCDGVDCFPGQSKEEMSASDLEAVKEHALSNGYEVFVVCEGIAYFRSQSAQGCHGAFKPRIGATTYVLVKVAV